MNEPVIDPWTITEIINNKSADSFKASVMSVSEPSTVDGVTRDLIPVNISGLREVRYTEVKAGSKVAPHSHHGPVFRIITEGEAIINGTKYGPGDWMVIPPGLEYEASTDSGYRALWLCITCEGDRVGK